MTNPSHKKTHEQFINQMNPALGITITGTYINTDTKIEYECKHGKWASLPWQMLKFKYCCRKGYYESGAMWKSNTRTLDELRDRALANYQLIDVSKTFIYKKKYKKLCNIRCIKHNIYFDSYGVKLGKCPECFREDNIEKIMLAGPIAWKTTRTGNSVSDAETKWLDSLNIKKRQIWLEDVRFKVDGYDPDTNTVYLYHGRFWHGCPNTFDPEMIHPIVKIPMKDLYERTIHYENKLRDAGYNLVVEWG